MTIRTRVRPRDESVTFDPQVFEKARRQLDDSLHGATLAPYVALDLIELAASGVPIEEGYAALADYQKKKDEVCTHASASIDAFKAEGATRLLEGPSKLATANKCAIPGLEDASTP